MEGLFSILTKQTFYSEPVHIDEIVQAISELLKRDITRDKLNKPEEANEITWQLLHVFYNMYPVQYSLIRLLVLCNRVANELQLPHQFRISDLGEQRDHTRLLTFYTAVLKCIQFKFMCTEPITCYNEVSSEKAKFAKSSEAIAERQSRLAKERLRLPSLQEAIDEQKRRFDQLSAMEQQEAAVLSSLHSRLDMAEQTSAQLKESNDQLEMDIQNLSSDRQKWNEQVIENVEMLPESIGQLKDCLHKVEEEMHSRYETASNITAKTTTFYHYESMLHELGDRVKEINVALSNYAELKGQIRSVRVDEEHVMEKFHTSQAEREQLSRVCNDLQSQILRQKLFVTTKHKTMQAKKKQYSKNLSSIRSDIDTYQKRGAQLDEQAVVLAAQETLSDAKLEKTEQYPPQVAKAHRLMTDIYAKLKKMDIGTDLP